jgi:hypothetical protein
MLDDFLISHVNNKFNVDFKSNSNLIINKNINNKNEI